MKSRERLTRLFNGQEIDRVPIWLLAPYHKYFTYADIYNIPSYAPLCKRISSDCDTFDRRGYDSGFCFNGNSEIISSSNSYDKDGNHIEEEIITFGNVTYKKSVSRGVSPTSVKFYIEEIEELEKILDFPYIPPTPDLSAYLQEKEELGEDGLMMNSVGDPLSTLHMLLSAENFSIFTLTDYDKILSFLDVIYKRTYDYYKYLLDNDVGEVFFLVGAEFAGPPLVSPHKFNELSVRYVKGLVDLIRSYGKKSILHYHGNLYTVLDGIKEINPDGLHTIEAPPVGDCTIAQAREKLGDMILIGNIQYDDLSRGSAEEIDKLVKIAMDEGKSGRFILSPTAGPYEAELSPKMMENYFALIDAGLKYGK